MFKINKNFETDGGPEYNRPGIELMHTTSSSLANTLSSVLVSRHKHIPFSYGFRFWKPNICGLSSCPHWYAWNVSQDTDCYSHLVPWNCPVFIWDERYEDTQLLFLRQPKNCQTQNMNLSSTAAAKLPNGSSMNSGTEGLTLPVNTQPNLSASPSFSMHTSNIIKFGIAFRNITTGKNSTNSADASKKQFVFIRPSVPSNN